MPKTLEHWIDTLRPLLERKGHSWERLLTSCEQIILFGSRAAGVSREGSDFDLLCIGTGQSRLRQGLDLVFVTPEDSRQERWLGHELAGHVARYGIWFVGEPDWVHKVRSSKTALDQKVEKIVRRLQAVEQHSKLLDPAYLHKYYVQTRRDLQRYEYLTNGAPVPPTPELDQAWVRLSDTEAELRRLAGKARVESRFLFERLSIYDRWPEPQR